MNWSGVKCQVSGVAATLLPVLLVLYPLLLLIDDLEPGFVRSVVNPHWFLAAMIVVGIVAGRGEGENVTLRQAQGVWGVVFAFAAALIVGIWVWWRLHAGTLGIIVALLAAISVGAVMLTVTDDR